MPRGRARSMNEPDRHIRPIPVATELSCAAAADLSPGGWRKGLTPIVNARGTFTPLGVSRSSPMVQATVAQALGAFVHIDELHRKVAVELARFAGAQAAAVTHCTAASLTVSVAALLAGDDPQRVAQLPDAHGMRRRIVIPAGHDVNYGHPLTIAVRLAGATVQVVDGGHEALAAALQGEDVAGLLSVWSRLVSPEKAMDPRQAVTLARGAGVPVVIDAAAQDLRLAEIVSTGADLVLVSAQKYLAGPTAGLIVGTEPLVQACIAQERGIGRAMKPSKEALAGVWAALQERRDMDRPAWQATQRRKVRSLTDALEGVPGLRVGGTADPQGLPFERVRVRVDPAYHRAGARALAEALREGDPSIWVMDHLAEQGELIMELVPLRDDEITLIADRIQAWACGKERRPVQ